jgi:signal transduction histidine kinase
MALRTDGDLAGSPAYGAAPQPAGRFVRLGSGHWNPVPDPRRADPARLLREIRLVSESPLVNAVLETADAILLVLNLERQIVAFNSRVPGLAAAEDIRGLRPGEALDCVNAGGPGGCGAAPACRSCGALGAILGCQERKLPIEAECSLRSEARGGATFELNARATAVVIDGHPFTVLSLRDISAEKRRRALEQVFFHDVLNAVTGLLGWAALLRKPTADRVRAADRVELLARQLEREIKHQRALVHAEDGMLVPEWADVPPRDILSDLSAICAEHPLARERQLDVDLAAPAAPLRTDRALVVRVLVNAVCNGLEAAPPGGAVRVFGEATGGGAAFHVQSPAVMPPEVQARVFQRSFSTKAAAGRGLGTYGMKLLGERFLGGKVSFVSRQDVGTIFTVALPARPTTA